MTEKKKAAAKTKRTFKRAPKKPVTKRATPAKKTSPKKEKSEQEMAEVVAFTPESQVIPDETKTPEKQTTVATEPATSSISDAHETSPEVQPATVEQSTSETPASGESADSATNVITPDGQAGAEGVVTPETTSEGDTNVAQTTQDVTVEQEGGGLRWILILVILFLVGLMGGLLYLFLLQNNNSSEKSKSTTTTLKTVAVYTATPTASTVDKTAYDIKVLNGSGTSGVAASARDFLTTSGYKVATIGNADTSNHTKTEIEIKDGVSQDFIQALEKDLGTKYTVDTKTTSLDNAASEDVIVIIGSDTAK